MHVTIWYSSTVQMHSCLHLTFLFNHSNSEMTGRRPAAVMSLISSVLVRKQSAVAFHLLWVCMVILRRKHCHIRTGHHFPKSTHSCAAHVTHLSVKHSVISGISVMGKAYVPIRELSICPLYIEWIHLKMCFHTKSSSQSPWGLSVWFEHSPHVCVGFFAVVRSPLSH